MQENILIAHVVVGLLFIFCVLIQDKGTGLSAALGGGGGFYASQRGAAKIIHTITVVLCVAFFSTALAFVVVPASPDAPATPAAESPISITPTIGNESVTVESAPVEVQ